MYIYTGHIYNTLWSSLVKGIFLIQLRHLKIHTYMYVYRTYIYR